MIESTIILSDAVEEFFEAKQAEQLSKNTIIDYRRTLNKFLAFMSEDYLIDKIQKRDIRKFIISQEGLSKKSLRNMCVGLSSLWTWCVNEGYLEENVVRTLDWPQPEIRAINPFTKSDVEAMLNASMRSRTYTRRGQKSCSHRLPNAYRNRAIILLLLDTGIRSSELCGLKFSSLGDGTIKVFGKGAKERALPIDRNTANAIDEYLQRKRGIYGKEDWVFVTKENEPIKRDVLSTMIKKIGDRAGVNKAHPHRFRHTFAINFLRNNGNIFALQMMLGHSTLEMVKRYLAIAEADLINVHKIASPVKNWNLN